MFTLVLTTHNNVRFTALAIASFRRMYPEAPIVVVDNASSDETRTYVRRLEKLKQNVRFIDNPGPVNLARSWNLGVEAATTDHVIVSNNDVVFAGRFYEQIRESLTHSEVGVVLPIDQHNLHYRISVGDVPTAEADQFMSMARASDERTTDAATKLMRMLDLTHARLKATASQPPAVQLDPCYKRGGFCFALSKEKWGKAGRFNDHRYDYWGEDWEFFARIQRNWKILVDPDWLVWHFGSITNSSIPQGERFDRLMRAMFTLIEDVDQQPETVSIVMPVFNRREEVRDAIRSVVDQTFKNWRLYIVVDGNDPGHHEVGKIAEEFGDRRIGCWWSTKTGPSGTRNFGIERTRGKYVALLDCDDAWRPWHLAQHVSRHESEVGVAMTYSNPDFAWRWWDSNRWIELQAPLPHFSYFREFDLAKLQEENFIMTSSTVWWGDTLRRLKFDETLRLEEDWELFRRAAKCGRITNLQTTTLRIHQQPGTNNLCEEAGWISPPEKPRIDPLVEGKKWSMASIVTCIIPTHNRLTSLDAAIQSCRGFPVIVVDDGSKDERAVAQIANRYGAKLVRQERSGPSRARNVAVRMANTPWVRFLDDDDILTSGWWVALERHAYDPVDLIIWQAACLNDSGLAIQHDPVRTSMLAYRVSSFLAIGGFDEAVDFAEDIDLLSRAALSGHRRIDVSEVGVVRAGSIGNRPRTLSQIHPTAHNRPMLGTRRA